MKPAGRPWYGAMLAVLLVIGLTACAGGPGGELVKQFFLSLRQSFRHLELDEHIQVPPRGILGVQTRHAVVRDPKPFARFRTRRDL